MGYSRTTLRGTSHRSCRFCNKRGKIGEEWVRDSFGVMPRFYHFKCYQEWALRRQGQQGQHSQNPGVKQ